MLATFCFYVQLALFFYFQLLVFTTFSIFFFILANAITKHFRTFFKF